ncbi:MAG: hypothetical protein RDV48_13995 [Candidatus Eremiobacteraeota bacterium]|nr:hypothetical protein [Candidatus Eremiobacteraeota bacterium]
MRTLEFERFIREKKENFFAVRAVLGRKRGTRRKNRDAAEREALMRMDKKRLSTWLNEGTLEIVSPNHFIFRL